MCAHVCNMSMHRRVSECAKALAVTSLWAVWRKYYWYHRVPIRSRDLVLDKT